MIEDKLTQDQRIRLECLALSVAVEQNTHSFSNRTLDRASEFETYIKNGKEDSDGR